MLRGMEGCQARMAELQAKLDALNPRAQISAKEAPIDGTSFRDFMTANGGGGLQGPIGAANPFGFQVRGNFGQDQLKSMANNAAIRNNIDPDLFSALVQVESGFDPAARSRAGAMGLTQLMPDTASQMGVSDPLDPEQSLNGGAKYLSQLLTKYDNNLPLALAAYNAGPGSVDKHGGKVPPYTETQNYVKKILDLYPNR